MNHLTELWIDWIHFSWILDPSKVVIFWQTPCSGGPGSIIKEGRNMGPKNSVPYTARFSKSRRTNS